MYNQQFFAPNGGIFASLTKRNPQRLIFKIQKIRPFCICKFIYMQFCANHEIHIIMLVNKISNSSHILKIITNKLNVVFQRQSRMHFITCNQLQKQMISKLKCMFSKDFIRNSTSLYNALQFCVHNTELHLIFCQYGVNITHVKKNVR